MMNGIDVASYQTGIDLSVVPCDFVIVKATEGSKASCWGSTITLMAT